MQLKKTTGQKLKSSSHKFPLEQELHKKLNSPNEISIFNDAELQLLLGESKRTLAYLRQSGQIAFIQKKPRAKIQYFSADILTYLNRFRHAAVHESRKF
jgi:hypothetical protein